MITRENREKLLIAKPAMRADVHAFVMEKYLTDKESSQEILEPENNLCGMACCIAGSFVAAHDKIDLMAVYGFDNAGSIPARAAEILGEFPQVFLLGNWADDLRWAYDKTKTDHDRVEVACQAVDEWVENPESFNRTDDNYLRDEDQLDYLINGR